MRRITMTLATLVVLLGFSAAEVYGQAITGTLVGNVTDSSGGVIAGAKVTATNLDTGVATATTTGGAGFYTIANLLPGRYSVTVEMKGFKTTVASSVVRVEENTRVDLSLAPGEVTETVKVTSEPPLVQSTTSDLGTVLEGPQINTLPLNGRLFQMMVFLVPGTTPGAWGDQDENPAASGSVMGGGAGNGTYAAVNGFPFEGNLFLVDGVTNVEPQNGYINLNIPFAAIEEMKIETSDPTAEFGTFGGAVVNLTTKSGTNQFHGQGFEYFRNDSLNATDHFAGSKNPYNANQFGGAVGGPIVKDKLFFFVDYQELLQNSSSPASLIVPTPAMRGGDLSALVNSSGAGPITNANACAAIATANGLPGVPCTASAAVTQAGTYDTIPAADISPIAANLMSTTYVPTPNVNSACANAAACPNFLANNPLTETAPQFDARVDFALSDKDRFFARESYLHRDYNNPSPGTIFLYGGNGSATNSNHNAVLAWDHLFSGTLSNQFRFGFNRYDTADFVPAYGVDANNAIGIPNGNLAGLPITSGIAQFTIQGINNGNALVGDQGPIPNGLGRLANIYEYTDGVTWVRGKHTFKFGGDIQWFQTSVRNPQNDPRGQFTFNGGYTGSGFADFLVGGPSNVNRDLFPSTPATRVKFGGIYAQDDIRVNQQLTLNLGLRWDVYTAPVDAHNAQSNFITTGPDAGLIQMASASNRGPNVNTFLGSWAPRIGVAYSPDNGKTALRAGFGISYFPDNFGSDGGTLERNYPETLIENNSAAQNSCATMIAASPLYSSCGSLILSNGLPGVTTGVYSPLVVPSNATPGALISPPVGFGVFQIAKDFRQDVATSWNLSVQRQLTHDMFFSAAYVGTYGNHLYHDYQLNQCVPPEEAGGGAPLNPYPNCLPFYSINPNITTVDFRNSSGQSRYNAGQFQLIKRTSVGLTLMASYTWSKMLSNVVNPINPYDTSLQLVGAGWQTSNYPQNFVLSYSYDLPFGHGRQFAGDSTGVKQAVIGGWAVSGITTFRSGGALLINAPGSLLPPQASQEVANYNCAGTSPDNPHTIAEWFNVGCWSSPAAYTFGNARTGTGNLYGPGLQNWDFSLSKTTNFGPEDRFGAKFEANFFNIFNHTNLSNPNTSCNAAALATCTAAGGFGVIGSDNGLPRMIQLGFKILF